MEIILALLIMISMSVAFSFYVAHKALKRNVNNVIFIAENSSADFVKQWRKQQYPYDWDTEERFESIVKDFNK